MTESIETIGGGKISAAEQCYQDAIRLATEQKAMAWNLRAALRLATVWKDAGKFEQAADLLTPIYNWFTEGFETPDLFDAKALLDELN